MRNFSLVIIGLIIVVSCSEEDHRIDLSYTGDQLSFIDVPIGGIETGHLLINGDGSIQEFNIIGTPLTDNPQTSMPFFSLYAAEEGSAAVVRMIGKQHFENSAGALAGSGCSKSSEILGSIDSSRGSGSSGCSECSVGTEGSGEAVQNFEAVTGFNEAVFHNAFPLVQVDFLDDEVPLEVNMSAWSPFIPLNTLNSNLPAAVFEWELTNPGKKPVSYSIALTMLNPLRTGGENRSFSLKETIITPHSVSGWKGFTFSNGDDNPLLHDTGTIRVLSSSENTFLVPLLGNSQKALVQFWTDFSTDGKLEFRGDNVKYSDENPGMAALYSSGVLDPGESVVIPFLFSWYVPFGHAVERQGVDIGEKEATYKRTGIPFENKPLASGGEGKPSSICLEDAPLVKCSEDTPSATCYEDTASTSRFEGKPSVSRFEGIDDITSYMVSGYKNLRDKTMQFSHSMITSTISPEMLDTVLSGFADAVEQRCKNMQVISNPFPYDGANGDPVEIIEGTYKDPMANGASGSPLVDEANGDPIDEGTYGDPAADGANEDPVNNKSTWDTYYSSSGFSYDKEARVIKFSPEKDVLPIRFFWATESGWGTINVSRARIVLDCIYGSLDLKRLILAGRSFFVFREFVPSHKAHITYDEETLLITITEVLSLTEGTSFTMEIP